MLLGNEMSDVWLSMEQAFENEIGAMLPDTDDDLSCEPGLTVNGLIDSAASLHELSQTIKTEALDFDDSSNGTKLLASMRLRAPQRTAGLGLCLHCLPALLTSLLQPAAHLCATSLTNLTAARINYCILISTIKYFANCCDCL